MLTQPEKIDQVINFLQEQKTKAMLLIAIDGQSASGKSTLAKAIGATLPNVSIVAMDDFYRPMAESERFALDAVGGYAHYYEWERLARQVLQPVRAGQTGFYQRYDWAANCLGDWLQVMPVGIVLVEGCYAARPELKAYYDEVLFVETPAKQRLKRQLERADASVAWLERWDAAEQFYLEQYQPHLYADWVIPGV